MPIDAAATQAFRNNPVGFLANAMILAPFANASRANHSEHMGLVRLGQGEPVTGTWTARTGPGGPLIPLYQVAKAAVNEASYFRSYIADYHQGQTTFTTLGTNPHAQFCFTANMNGCTFGLGSQPTPGSAMVVSHGNAANAGANDNIPDYLAGDTKKALQTAIQYTRAKQGHGITGRVFEPAHYRIGQRMSVTFGHRAAGQKWAFHFVGYERTGGHGAPVVFISHGVGPMLTNAITA